MVVVDGLPADSSLNGIAADERPRGKYSLQDGSGLLVAQHQLITSISGRSQVVGTHVTRLGEEDHQARVIALDSIGGQRVIAVLGRSLTAAIASLASLRATLAALVLAGLVVSFAGSVLTNRREHHASLERARHGGGAYRAWRLWGGNRHAAPGAPSNRDPAERHLPRCCVLLGVLGFPASRLVFEFHSRQQATEFGANDRAVDHNGRTRNRNFASILGRQNGLFGRKQLAIPPTHNPDGIQNPQWAVLRVAA